MKSCKIISYRSTSPAFAARIAYVFDFLEQHPLMKGKLCFVEVEEKPDLQYGAAAEDTAFYVPAQALVFTTDFILPSTTQANAYEYESFTLHSIEKERKEKTAFFENGHFGFDWIEMLFFHLSRIEEFFCKKGQLDDCDRMKSTEQFLVKNQIHRKPVVDHLVAALRQIWGVSAELPPTEYIITHDIDAIHPDRSPYGLLRYAGNMILRKRNLLAAFRLFGSLFSRKNPYDTFDWMLGADKGKKRLIFFLVGGKTLYDTPFDLNDSIVTRAIQKARIAEYEIGLHPSYACWKEEALLREEKELLTEIVEAILTVNRQHYLHFSFPETANILENLQFKKDYSLGFNDRIGFRCGTGFGYRLYNFAEERAFRFIEVPLIWMDSAHFKEWNNQSAAIQADWKEFLAENAYGTQLTFNFHNTRFYDAYLHGIPLREMYESLRD